MHPTTQAARQRLIETAAQLFQAQGYHHTGLNQILAKSRAPKGSLYHYFPEGKEQLACAAVAHSAQQVAAQLLERIAAASGPLDAIERLIQYFVDELEDSGFRKGCPVATVTLEAAADSPRIRAACAQAYALWQGGLEQYLRAHGVPAAAQKAESFLVAVEGALLLSRARHDCAPLRQLKKTIPLLLTLTEV